MKLLYKLDNISLSTKQKYLFKEVSLKMMPGKTYALMGPNGAGKTSLLRTLTGETHAKLHGHIRFKHKDLSQWTLKQLAQYRAVCPQDHCLNFPLYVEDIIAMGLYPYPHLTQKKKNLPLQ